MSAHHPHPKCEPFSRLGASQHPLTPVPVMSSPPAGSGLQRRTWGAPWVQTLAPTALTWLPG